MFSPRGAEEDCCGAEGAMGKGEGGDEEGLICRWHRRLATEGELRYSFFGASMGLSYWPAVP